MQWVINPPPSLLSIPLTTMVPLLPFSYACNKASNYAHFPHQILWCRYYLWAGCQQQNGRRQMKVSERPEQWWWKEQCEVIFKKPWKLQYTPVKSPPKFSGQDGSRKKCWKRHLDYDFRGKSWGFHLWSFFRKFMGFQPKLRNRTALLRSKTCLPISGSNQLLKSSSETAFTHSL